MRKVSAVSCMTVMGLIMTLVAALDEDEDIFVELTDADILKDDTSSGALVPTETTGETSAETHSGETASEGEEAASGEESSGGSSIKDLSMPDWLVVTILVVCGLFALVFCVFYIIWLI